MQHISRANGFPRRVSARPWGYARACGLIAILALAGCSKDDSNAQSPAEPASKSAEIQATGAGGQDAAAAHGQVNPHGQANPHGNAPAPAAARTTADGKRVLGGIAVAAPEGWNEEPVTSNMRRAQWKIPGDGGEAELVVFYFGQAGAGSVEKNLERWYGQFQQADGRPSGEVAETTEKTIADMKVTRAEVGGRYVAAVRPGAEARHDVPDARMIAAIVEAPGGAYYFKMVGADATVKAAAAGFDAMLDSLAKVQ